MDVVGEELPRVGEAEGQVGGMLAFTTLLSTLELPMVRWVPMASSTLEVHRVVLRIKRVDRRHLLVQPLFLVVRPGVAVTKLPPLLRLLNESHFLEL